MSTSFSISPSLVSAKPFLFFFFGGGGGDSHDPS